MSFTHNLFPQKKRKKKNRELHWHDFGSYSIITTTASTATSSSPSTVTSKAATTVTTAAPSTVCMSELTAHTPRNSESDSRTENPRVSFLLERASRNSKFKLSATTPPRHNPQTHSALIADVDCRRLGTIPHRDQGLGQARRLHPPPPRGQQKIAASPPQPFLDDLVPRLVGSWPDLRRPYLVSR